MILHVFSSWVCDLLDIMKINLSKLVIMIRNMDVFQRRNCPLQGTCTDEPVCHGNIRVLRIG